MDDGVTGDEALALVSPGWLGGALGLVAPSPGYDGLLWVVIAEYWCGGCCAA